jgi:dihydroflavonol-4-reductase
VDRIGITGANGFIGSHLLRSAVARGHRPIAFVERGTSLLPVADLEERFDLVEGDLLDPASVARFVSRCTYVVHLAGINRYWLREPAQFHQINVTGARNVAQACLQHRVRRLLHVSSCITLGTSATPIPRDEDAGYNLTFPFLYGETKKAGEELIQRLVQEDGLPAVIVHPTSVIGEYDHAPTPVGRPIASIARGALPVHVGGGACFIDVHDLVRGLWLALERGAVGRRYLLAGENMTNHAFMSLVAEVAGAPRPRLRVPWPVLAVAGRAAEWLADHVTRRPPPLTWGMSALTGSYLYFDGTRAARELGFVAGPVAPAIERCVRWFREGR